MLLDNFLKNKKRVVLIGVIFFTLTLVTLVTTALISQKTFYKGVLIDNIDVSGLDKERAAELITSYMNQEYGNHKLTLNYGDTVWSLKLSDISFYYAVEEGVQTAFAIGRQGNIFQRLGKILSLRFNNVNIMLQSGFNGDQLSLYLSSIKSQIDRNAKDAAVKYKNGNITVNKEITGRSIDIDNNLKIIANEIAGRNFNNIKLSVDEVQPKFLYEDLKEIGSVTASFTTSFNSQDSNRTHNIRLACEKINGMILLPDEIFSMNKALGPRTLENGYKDAPVIYKNELIPGPGGGICQVTTTLYGSVLKSKINVVERTHHTLPLGYVDPGQDATIAEDYIDFKFRNNKGYPVAIIAEVAGNSLNIRILGKKDDENRNVKIRSVIVEQFIPEGEEVIIDNTMLDGEKQISREPKTGMRVVVYRETYNKAGQLLEKEKISDDIYKPVKAQVKVNQNYFNNKS